MKKALRIIQVLFLIFGTFCLFNGIIISMTSNFNLGNILTFLLGIVLVTVSVLWNKLREKAPSWLRIAFFSILSVVIVFSASLYFYGKSDSVTYDEDAVIVLGAGLRGERPSATLRSRLNTAIEYHKNNPDAVIVVSGGKGHDESISEALAMERYLVSAGVPQSSIVKEEGSTSTYENFRFSKQLLDSFFNNGYTIAYITNEYHIFRAGNIARDAGFENTSHIHSDTVWHSVLPGVLRECIGVMKYYVLGY